MASIGPVGRGNNPESHKKVEPAKEVTSREAPADNPQADSDQTRRQGNEAFKDQLTGNTLPSSSHKKGEFGEESHLTKQECEDLLRRYNLDPYNLDRENPMKGAKIPADPALLEFILKVIERLREFNHEL